ncbi:MAG TPA: SEC-C metal-binding domain-containing protein, partial [Candidatus Ozemobacteraceae bacterium]|nr:SEC-C metal-binding domain-containing protein [Candidatus Ozemobacteraceae bacterium]
EPDDWDYEAFADGLIKVFPIERSVDHWKKLSSDELHEELKSSIFAALEAKRQEVGPDDFKQLEKFVLLQVVDTKWKDHLHNMDNLQDGIHLRSWGQRDPLVEYKIEGHNMFQDMIESIKEDVLYYVFRMQYSRAEEKETVEQKQQEMSYNRGPDEGTAAAPKRAGAQIGRNDPCPCGSGKKYKKCCGQGS